MSGHCAGRSCRTRPDRRPSFLTRRRPAGSLETERPCGETGRPGLPGAAGAGAHERARRVLAVARLRAVVSGRAPLGRRLDQASSRASAGFSALPAADVLRRGPAGRAWSHSWRWRVLGLGGGPVVGAVLEQEQRGAAGAGASAGVGRVVGDVLRQTDQGLDSLGAAAASPSGRGPGRSREEADDLAAGRRPRGRSAASI